MSKRDAEYGSEITGVAFYFDQGARIVSLPKPNRHHNLFAECARLGIPQEETFHAEQGFVTNTGKFLRRKPAFGFATRNKLLVRKPTAPFHGLFSEDVW